MGLFDAFKSLSKKQYVTQIPAFMDAASDAIQERAPADHTHGAGGEVVGVGANTARPAVLDGFVFSNTDTERLEILDVDGNVKLDIAPMPGYIAGMQMSYASATEITIQPGVVEIVGRLYVLPSAVTITVATSSTLTWRAVRIAPPASGNILTASNFADVAATSTYIEKSDDGTYWQRVGLPTYRVIGLYPTSGSSVRATFKTINGFYYAYIQTVNDSSPPSTATSYAVGLPGLGEYVTGTFKASISGDSSTTNIQFDIGGIPQLVADGNDCVGLVMTNSTDGNANLRVAATGGSGDLMALYLLYVTVPSGMAR